MQEEQAEAAPIAMDVNKGMTADKGHDAEEDVAMEVNSD